MLEPLLPPEPTPPPAGPGKWLAFLLIGVPVGYLVGSILLGSPPNFIVGACLMIVGGGTWQVIHHRNKGRGSD